MTRVPRTKASPALEDVLAKGRARFKVKKTWRERIGDCLHDLPDVLIPMSLFICSVGLLVSVVAITFSII